MVKHVVRNTNDTLRLISDLSKSLDLDEATAKGRMATLEELGEAGSGGDARRATMEKSREAS